MDEEIAGLIAKIRQLEEDLEDKFEERSEWLSFEIDRRKVIFERAVRQEHRRLRTGLLSYLRHSPILSILTSPVVYAMAVPLVLLDVSVTLFQAICFRAWRLTRARRADYVVIDRQYLAYLNGIEKLNCIFCGYANGVIAFTREVAARTEQYFCPIKHAKRVRTPHDRYRDFIDYGDAEAWQKLLEDFRRDSA